jgi:hypothetical protein
LVCAFSHAQAPSKQFPRREIEITREALYWQSVLLAPQPFTVFFLYCIFAAAAAAVSFLRRKRLRAIFVPRKIKLWRLIAELSRGSVFFPSLTFNTQRNENKRWSRGVPICASGTFHPPTHAKSAVAAQRASSGSRPSIQFTSAAAVVSVLSGAMPCHAIDSSFSFESAMT